MAEDTQTTESQETDTPVIDTTELFYPSSETEAKPTIEAKAEVEQQAEVTPEEEPETTTEESSDKQESPEGSEEGTAESEPGSEEQKFENSELYVELEGDDVSIEQILKWKSEGMMQSDYTKKTQKLADERRVFETDRDSEVNKIVSEKINSYKDNIALMEVLIAEADLDQYGDPIDWKQLRKDDIEEYDRLKSIKDKRTRAVEESRTKSTQTSNEDIQTKANSEMAVLTKDNKWVGEDGKKSEVYDVDMAMVKDQLDKAGISEQERGGMLITGYGQWIIDACRWRQSQEKVNKVKAKVKKLPITTKPKANAGSKPKSTSELFYGTS